MSLCLVLELRGELGMSYLFSSASTGREGLGTECRDTYSAPVYANVQYLFSYHVMLYILCNTGFGLF